MNDLKVYCLRYRYIKDGEEEIKDSIRHIKTNSSKNIESLMSKRSQELKQLGMKIISYRYFELKDEDIVCI